MNPTTVWQQLFYTTVLIETDLGCGTGFVVNLKNETSVHPILITNKHVVKGAKEGIVRFHLASEAGDLIDGKGYKLSIPELERYWIGHPDENVDVTAMSMSMILKHAKESGKRLFYKGIPQEMFPSEDDIERLDAVEEIMFVGYPSGMYDQKNYLPIVRRGITASPLQVDYEGRPEFLIDASVFPGSSGSPVLILNKGETLLRDAEKVYVTSGFILGIISAAHQQWIPESESSEKGNLHLMDLGVVFKARAILEAARPFRGIVGPTAKAF